MKSDPLNTNPFEDWFFQTHKGTGVPTWEEEEVEEYDEDADEVLEDDYSEEDNE